MDALVKAFCTYATISMLCGLFVIILTMGGVIDYRAVPSWVIMVLWMGPILLGLTAALPVGLYYLWKM